MGHQVPGFRVVKIGRRKCLNVLKKLVSQALLDPTGYTQKKKPPEIPENAINKAIAVI
jgi:hypothetical protein